MKTIIEDPIELIQQEQDAKSEKEKPTSHLTSTKQFNQIKEHNKDHSKEQVNKNGVDQEIYSFIEDIQKQNNKASKFNKPSQVKSLYSIKEKTVVNSNQDKFNKKNIGLSDNQTVDSENKSKAQKGLLLLLNKISGGEFVPEIVNYFNKKTEEIKINMKEIEEKSESEENLKPQRGEKKKVSRQINNVKGDDKLVKEEGSDLDSLSKKYKQSNIDKLKNNKALNKASQLNRYKIYIEDDGYDIYDRFLILNFTKEEAIKYAEERRNNEDHDSKLVLNKVSSNKRDSTIFPSNTNLKTSSKRK